MNETNGKTNGIVKWFNSKLGYGFIVPEDEYDENDLDKGTEIFVHYSSITTPEDNGFKTLYRGDKVEFESVENEKGLEAQQVAITEKSPRREKYRRNSDDEEGEEESEEATEEELEEEDELEEEEEVAEKESESEEESEEATEEELETTEDELEKAPEEAAE